MIIAPLVFSVLVVGIAKVGDFNAVGRIGAKTMSYFIFATLLSLTLGLVLVNIFKLGRDHEHSPAAVGCRFRVSAKALDLKSFISHIFPASVIDAMANNEILPIVVFSIFFGIGTAAIGEQGKVVVKAMDAISHVMFKVTNFVMNFAPYGVFGAMAAVVSKAGNRHSQRVRIPDRLLLRRTDLFHRHCAVGYLPGGWGALWPVAGLH